MDLTLIRTKQSDQGTLGQLRVSDKLTLYTIELPYFDLNHDGKSDPSISCVPPGKTYPVKFMWSPKHNSNKYQLLGVDGRDFVEIHVGNFAGNTTLKDSAGNQVYQSDVQGCILLGKSFGLLKNKFGNMQEAVLDSVIAVKQFEDCMGGQLFNLTIKML